VFSPRMYTCKCVHFDISLQEVLLWRFDGWTKTPSQYSRYQPIFKSGKSYPTNVSFKLKLFIYFFRFIWHRNARKVAVRSLAFLFLIVYIRISILGHMGSAILTETFHAFTQFLYGNYVAKFESRLQALTSAFFSIHHPP
jgi:hypothetical protein